MTPPLALAACSSPEPDAKTIDIATKFSDSKSEMIDICEPVDDTLIFVFHREGEYAYLMMDQPMFSFSEPSRLAREISTKEFALNICKGH